MNENESALLAASRELAYGLQHLGSVTAPASLLPAVMRRIGLGDAYGTLDTPLGRVFVAYNEHGVSAVQHAATPAEFESRFRAQCGRPVYPIDELPQTLNNALRRHLRGERAPLRFDLRGLSEFERAVLRKALEIPRGEVRPYSWVAREIGAPKAVRAVGTALGHNPIPLLIPCHRVVRSNGHIGQYSLGGPEAKRTMLAAEGGDPDALEEMARRGVRYHGSDTTHIFCLPTCRDARRIGDRHRVAFRSEAEAVASGYRPCQHCRPA